MVSLIFFSLGILLNLSVSLMHAHTVWFLAKGTINSKWAVVVFVSKEEDLEFLGID